MVYLITDEALAEYTKQVERGIALLDDQLRLLGWRGQIDKEILNMGSCTDCILGQLFGDYLVGRRHIVGDRQPWYYGFDIRENSDPDSHMRFVALTKAWKLLLDRPDA